MADSTRDLAIYCKESVVRGHHVFKRIWTPVVGEVLTVAREAGNTEDRFAVAVTKDDMVVGHVPREFSKLCWHFLRHGGTIACLISQRLHKLYSLGSCGWLNCMVDLPRSLTFCAPQVQNAST